MTATVSRSLGRSNIQISAMGMGCWAIGGPFWAGETPLGWGQVDDEESIRAIHAALDLGVTFFDTANAYGAGHSEKVLARALKNRKDVVIATKFSSVFDETTRQISGSDSTPAGIRQACEDSLRRLERDVIDLFQFHDNGFPPEKAGPVRDTLEALVGEGKIRAYGWSTDFPKSAEFFARGGEHCATIQAELNVFDDNPAVVAICEKHNLGLINRGPLAMGLLTGKYNLDTKPSIDDVRGEKSPEWMRYFKDGKPNVVYMEKMNAVREILTSNGRTVAQGALAWLWARSPKTIPIPGFRTVQQVKDNAGALALGPLTQAQFVEVEKILGRW